MPRPLRGHTGGRCRVVCSQLAGHPVAGDTLFDQHLQFVQQRWISGIEVEAGLALHMLLQGWADAGQQVGEGVDGHEME